MHRYHVIKLSDLTLSATTVTSFPKKKDALSRAWDLEARTQSANISYEVWDADKKEFIE